jgi:hypothetical protein
MLPGLPIRRIAVLAMAMGLGFGVVGLTVAIAASTLAHEEQQGQRLAESLSSGERQCSDLSADDFELIGEYAMGRYLGDEATHEAMNRQMTVRMGSAGEERMHRALGYRYSGCPGGPGAGWVGPMGGMMSGNYEGGSGGFGGGMMGGGHRGGMMGFGDSGDSDISVLGVVLIALAAAAVGGAVVFAVMRPSRIDR